MKINVLLTGVIGLILSSCTGDYAEQENVLKGNNNLKIEVVDALNSNMTRAAYESFPSTTFETGDEIGVYVFNGSSYVFQNVRFVRQSDGSWLPDEEVPYATDNTYYAYFPYRSTVYTPSTSGTVDAVDTRFENFISDTSNYFWQADQSSKAGFTYSNLMIAKGVITDTDEDAVTIKFTMQHKRGLVSFDGDGSADATFTGNIPYLIGVTKKFLTKPLVETFFTDQTGTYSITTLAGKCITHYIPSEFIDLSMVDNSGKSRPDGRTTANCYMVHAAGKYKIPLVYGNAIKDGVTNISAYQRTTSTSSTYAVTNNLWGVDNNSNRVTITDPWIKNNNVPLTAARLVWQDVNGLISDVEIVNDYLTFTVNTFSPGNAVIAVQTRNGGSDLYAAWSWHIWVTDETYENLTTVDTGDRTYQVTPVNLGWVPTGGDGKQGYCTYYQWSRKDPFPPSNGAGNTDHTVYDRNGNTYTLSTTSGNQSYNMVKYADKPSSASANVMDAYYNLWNINYAGSGAKQDASATVKTIYDPCPPDFCVPTNDLFYFMANNSGRTMTTWDSTNKGCTWSNAVVDGSVITGDPLWFPACGQRYASGSTYPLSAVGTEGCYWAATGYKSSGWMIYQNGYGLNTRTGYWYNNSYSSNAGFAIRPVAEE